MEEGAEPEGDNIEDSAPNGQDDGREEVDEPSEDSNAAASDIFDEQGRFIRFDFVIEFETWKPEHQELHRKLAASKSINQS